MPNGAGVQSLARGRTGPRAPHACALRAGGGGAAGSGSGPRLFAGSVQGPYAYLLSAGTKGCSRVLFL